MVEKFMVEISRVERFMVEKSGVEKFMVEKSGVEKFLLALELKSPGLKCPFLNCILELKVM